uniref:Uncharacterized protein n=1 Tax=Physcomitrium patens TaxID=3218 RepID=A0A2K1IV77_PHYPA|nr:hypothetical protein PHYPA_025123 [Physcomitrium patens]
MATRLENCKSSHLKSSPDIPSSGSPLLLSQCTTTTTTTISPSQQKSLKSHEVNNLMDITYKINDRKQPSWEKKLVNASQCFYPTLEAEVYSFPMAPWLALASPHTVPHLMLDLGRVKACVLKVISLRLLFLLF